MIVDVKIRFAEYFLSKIKDAPTREELLPNFSAFLSEARSIADHLLQDYNLEYGLKIEYLTPKTFKEKACDKVNLDALKFISTYNSKFKKLRKNKLANYLFKKRNDDVHKETDPLRGHFSRGMIDSVEWEFVDYDNIDKNVVPLCEEYLNLMKNFVDDLNSQFLRK